MVEATLEAFLTQQALLEPTRETHFVVAFSGGRDSTALLHALAQLKQTTFPHLKLTAGYYWHPWRPLQEDLQIVGHHCQRLGIQWVMLTPNLKLPKSEAAARTDRYQQLAHLATDCNANAVLTAHHQDDQVETILFRILRGTGLEGLSGIPQRRAISIHGDQAMILLRPLLDLPRQAIDDYVKTHQLPYVEDPTNINTQLKRNFIRHEIIPKLTSGFPQSRQSLLQLAELVTGECEIIDQKMETLWHDLYDPKTMSLDEVQFNQLSLPFQRRLMRRFLDQAGFEPGMHKIQEAIDFIAGKKRNAGRPGLLSLDDKRFLSVYRTQITVQAPKKNQLNPLVITVPGEVSHPQLKATLMITALPLEERFRPVDFRRFTEEEILVDLAEYVGQELTLRTRQPGDYMTPLGMKAPVKLKDFLINRHIPRFERDWIPLLTHGSEILWAVGVGVNERIRIKTRPTHRLILKRAEASG